MTPPSVNKSNFISINAVLFFLFVIVTSWQCFEVPPDPVMPSWNVQLSVPLIDTVFYLNDALKDNHDIMTSGTHYEYAPEQLTFDSIGISENLRLNPASDISVEKSLGTFQVSTSPVSATVTASMLLGTVPANPSVIPQFTWQNTVQMSLIDEFEYVHFTSGNFILSVRNSLPFAVSFPNGIKIYNQSTNDLVASFPSVVSIPANSTWSPSASSLAGIVVSNRLKVQVDLASDGSAPNVVTVNPDSGLTVTASISGSEADEIQAKSFNRLDFSAAFNSLVFDDSSYFQQVLLKNGRMRLQIQNTLPIALTARITVDELRNISNDQPVLLEVPLNAHTTSSTDYYLDQWKLEAANGITNSLTCSLSISSQTLSSATSVLLKSTDKIHISLQSFDAPFAVKKFSGVPKPTWFTVLDTLDLDLGNISSHFTADSVILDSITMRLKLYSSGGIPVDFNLRLQGINNAGMVITTANLQPGGSPDPAMFRLSPDHHVTASFNNLSRFISAYLTQGGEKIIIRGAALVNPTDIYNTRQVGTITDTSRFYSSLDVKTLLSFGIFNGVFSDTIDISNNGEDKIDKDILTKIHQASVFFKIENAMRMGVQLTTSFRDVNNTSILSLPKTGQPPLAIIAGTPEVPAQTPTPIRVSIATDDADTFNEAQRVIVRLYVNSGNQYARFTTSDYIRIRAYANIVAEVNNK